MGVVTPRTLYHILWAANTYAASRDPSSEIKQYMIANQLLTANVRTDSGQPDAWRDYQQILPELGLIFSTAIEDQIRPTPLGLSFLDGAISFSELMAYQALRYQYPNGHQVAIQRPQRQLLSGTQYESTPTLSEIQQLSGVRIRPAVLVWHVLRALEGAGERVSLSVSELENYLVRCYRHEDTNACIEAVLRSRRNGIALPSYGSHARRNAQDWIKFLILTGLFGGAAGAGANVGIALVSEEDRAAIDDICARLVSPASFWNTTNVHQIDRRGWYGYFGTLDLSVPFIPAPQVSDEASSEYVGGREHIEPSEESETVGGITAMQLQPFQPISIGSPSSSSQTIESIYSAELSISAHRLHDTMVNLIASRCSARGATVFQDPSTVDLLVQFREIEFLIEVKSVTPRNFISRLRYAIGQVLHYDYLRSIGSTVQRRRVIGVAAQVRPDSWCIEFVNGHLHFDLLSLHDRALAVSSQEPAANELFG